MIRCLEGQHLDLVNTKPPPNTQCQVPTVPIFLLSFSLSPSSVSQAPQFSAPQGPASWIRGHPAVPRPCLPLTLFPGQHRLCSPHPFSAPLGPRLQRGPSAPPTSPTLPSLVTTQVMPCLCPGISRTFSILTHCCCVLQLPGKTRGTQERTLPPPSARPTTPSVDASTLAPSLLLRTRYPNFMKAATPPPSSLNKVTGSSLPPFPRLYKHDVYFTLQKCRETSGKTRARLSPNTVRLEFGFLDKSQDSP